MSTSTGGSSKPTDSSRGEGLNEAYRRRLAVFTALVAIVAAFGVWMALTSVDRGTGGMELVTISSGVKPEAGDVTLKAALLPENSNGLGRRLMANPRVKALAGDHELFLSETPDGRKTLCVGLFESADDPELERLMQRFRELQLNGRNVFPKAHPRRVSPHGGDSRYR